MSNAGIEPEQQALTYLQYRGLREGLDGFVPSFEGRPGTDRIVIGRVEGRDLRELSPQERRGIPEGAWQRFFTDIAAMNRIGVSHNDINAGNVIWDGERLHLIDFGLSTLGSVRRAYRGEESNDLATAKEIRKRAREGTDLFVVMASGGKVAVPVDFIGFERSAPAPRELSSEIPGDVEHADVSLSAPDSRISRAF